MAKYCRVGVFGLRGVDDLCERALLRGRAHAALKLFAQAYEFERHRDVAAESSEHVSLLVAQVGVADEERAPYLFADVEREQLDHGLVLRRRATSRGQGD